MELSDQPTAGAFHGSYDPEDCVFLLKPLDIAPTPTTEKERLIQSGERHYSELHTGESLPAPRYLALFRELTHRHARRVAGDILSLARHIIATRTAPLTVVSLARAGTPVGALLTRALRGHDPMVMHYSISIVRDRGIDTNALRHLLRVARRPAAGVLFVDGWTAKGVIGRELGRAVLDWNAAEPETLDPRLYVLSDIAGQADVAASHDDYAIPSGILNATVSGLVSRSIINEQIGPADFHGCVHYRELAPLDQSVWFLDTVERAFARARPRPIDAARKPVRARLTRRWLDHCRRLHRIEDENLIKPGVAEATRVLLRRVPDRVIVRDQGSPEVAHLMDLARRHDVQTERDPDMPFEAVALIRSLRDAPAARPPVRSNEP